MPEKGKPTDKGGKPPVVFTEDDTSKVEALSAYLNQRQIADYFGVSEGTFGAVMERQPEVSVAYKKGKAKAVGKVGQGLLQKAIEGNLTAMIFYLKTQGGYRETSALDVTSGDAPIIPPQINVVPKKKAGGSKD